jgi:ABC-type nitrate/sulfonate/bicarbonate transport system substrate-binding protein
MVDKADDSEVEQIVDDLDGVLPDEIDRRRFVDGALGLIGAGMFAGCTGNSGSGGSAGSDNGSAGSDNGSAGSDNGSNESGGGSTSTSNGNGGRFSDDEEVVFTTSWKKEPSHGPVHITELKGYWEDEGLAGVDGVRGNGSDTESLNIGTGNKEMGYASFATAISVWPGDEDIEALNMSLMGMAAARPFLSLIWRKDKLEDYTDVAGKDVLLASGFAASTWDMYPALVDVDASKVNTQEAGEETGPPALANNNVQAIWGSVDLLSSYQEEVDAELGVTPITEFGAIPGLPIWVNNEWYNNKDNAVEFMAAVLTGYHKALKWCLLNGDAYIKYMQNEVNPNLQTWTEEELYGQYQSFLATAVNLDYKEERIGYFTQEGVQTGIDGAAAGLLDDPDVVPPASEIVKREAFEASEPVTFTDDEWNQVAEGAGAFWGIFKEAESDN